MASESEKVIKERGQYRRVSAQRQEKSGRILKKVEVYWGGAPHSQLYESRASLTTLADREMVVPPGAAPGHGAHLAHKGV